MKRHCLITQLIILFYNFASAQVQDTTVTDFEIILEEVLENSFSEEYESEAFSSFEDLLLNPVDINSANIEQLTSIPFLNFKLASIIISHREKFGPFLNVNELFSISELSTELVNKIIPFVKIDNALKIDSTYLPAFDKQSSLLSFFGNLNINVRSRFGSDLQTREGFLNGNYAGSKLKAYNRMIIKNSSNIQAGIIIEKDAGEKSFMDYYSYHFSLRNYGLLRHLVVGDYNLEFGQGLLLWNSFSFSKGSDAIFPVKKKSRNIKSNTGTSEYGFFRGISLNLALYDFNLIFFYSSKKIDANIDSITSEIKSLPSTGVHATKNEILRKNNVTETLSGSRLEYSPNQSNKFGITFYKSDFSNPFQKNSVFDLSGNKFFFYSLDFDNYFGPLNLFGEIANDKNTTSLYGGLIVSPFTKLQFATSIRYYPKNFNNLHAFGFGEQSGKTQNEIGFYSGIKFNSELGLFNIYYDKFKFPNHTYENPIPSNGDEFFLSFKRKINKELEIHLRFKNEIKEATESINNLKTLVLRVRNSIRTEFDYFLTTQLKFRTRFEYNTYEIKSIRLIEKGFLIYEDIKLSPLKDLTLYGRIILFDTDSFKSAVYEYENDLIGLFSNLAMYGEGVRYYIVIRYKPLKNLSFSMKYAETYKPNEKFLSSGNNKINGNVDNRFNFQIDFSL